MIKNYLFFAIFAVVALVANANSGIYLRGDVCGWNADAEWEFVDEGDGVYTLTDKVLFGAFKIADANWGTFNYGASAGSLSLGESYNLAYGSNDNLSIAEGLTWNCDKITLTIDGNGDGVLLIEGTQDGDIVDEGYEVYILGGINNWSASEYWLFNYEGNGVYTLTDKELYGDFKIADPTWSVVNFGASGGVPELGVPYNLVSGSNDNVSLGDNTYHCDKITFDINAKTLLLEGTAVGGEEITTVYVIGTNNNWDFNDESGALAATGNDGEFAGRVTMVGVETESGEISWCYWRIFEGLGQRGSWGTLSGTDTDDHVTEGTLVKGSNGCITTLPGVYDMVFNINTGDFKLTSVGGAVKSVAGDAVSVAGGYGEILIVGGEAVRVEVYSTGGALVGYGAGRVEVPAGVYLVKAGENVSKVIVK